MQSFSEIIATTWPTAEDMASEIGASVVAVRKWKQRNSIPSEWWLDIVDATLARGKPVTLEMLAGAAALKRSLPMEAAE